jgi:hypothetical protein
MNTTTTARYIVTTTGEQDDTPCSDWANGPVTRDEVEGLVAEWDILSDFYWTSDTTAVATCATYDNDGEPVEESIYFTLSPVTDCVDAPAKCLACDKPVSEQPDYVNTCDARCENCGVWADTWCVLLGHLCYYCDEVLDEHGNRRDEPTPAPTPRTAPLAFTWTHHEGWGFNVKAHSVWPDSDAVNALTPEQWERAWERTRQRFWDQAEEAARIAGFGGVECAGRSGGWLLPVDSYDGHPIGGTYGPGGDYYTGPEWSSEYCGEPVLEAGHRASLERLAQDLADFMADVPAVMDYEARQLLTVPCEHCGSDDPDDAPDYVVADLTFCGPTCAQEHGDLLEAEAGAATKRAMRFLEDAATLRAQARALAAT